MITYATTGDYTRYLDDEVTLRELTWRPIGDLKEYQRYWAYEYIKSRLSADSKVLEIGSGKPNLLRTLRKNFGCECWGMDPFTGSGSGPKAFELMTQVFGEIRLVKGSIGEHSHELPDQYFDFVFSVSALEHIPHEQWEPCFKDMMRVARDEAWIFHAIDCPLDGEYQQPLDSNPLFDALTSIATLDGLEYEDAGRLVDFAEIQRASDVFVISPLYWHALGKKYPDDPWFQTYKRVTSVNASFRKSRVAADRSSET